MHLAAYGIEDMFLTDDPQITYFKIVYRRHTNFSIEEIRQNLLQTLHRNMHHSASSKGLRGIQR